MFRLESLKRGAGAVFAIVAGALFMARVHAQLAITEVMSSAADTFGPSIVTTNSDFWELTNFGTNTIDLTEFRFTDGDHPNGRTPLAPTGSPPLLILPFQSVIFVRDNVSSNETQIREWWGSCLDLKAQIRFYSDPGLSRYGDILTVYDGANQMVDTVEFDWALRGASFVYDPNTGAFGVRSVAGQGGACRAETADDVGSPGHTPGPIPLRILRQPQSMVIYSRLSSTLSVDAVGMPRPKYQWFFNGTAMLGATKSNLTLSSMDSSKTGSYHVRVSNGLSTSISSNAIVTLNTTPTPPIIIAPPVNATALVNRSARFNILVASLPLATYQWFLNGVHLTNEVGRSLLIPNCTLEMSGAEVRVRAENSLGSVEASARLFVTTRLDLRITEFQAYPVECEDHNDWFEVTNFGTNEVQLLGYRFYDKANLEEAVVVTEPLSLQPHESAIFVKNSSVGSFFEWWGVENLPPGLKVFSYSGFSLNRGGETLYLWSESAETRFETIDEVAFERSQTGITQWFDKDTAPFGNGSAPGREGAFRAVECGDIGSPGYIGNPPPRFVSVTRDKFGAKFKWRAIEGARYQVIYSSTLANGWSTLGSITPTNSPAEMIDPGGNDANSRFYRIMEIPP